MTGMYAAVSINAALVHAKATGEGQFIDIGMLDTQVAWLANIGMNYIHSGDLGRIGNDHPNIVPYRPFRTSDGNVIIVVGNDDQFRRFAKICEKEELADDPRFNTNMQRVANRDELAGILDPIVASKSSEFWLNALEENNVGCGPINNLEQVFENPQVKARGMVHQMSNSVDGGTPVDLIASPMKFSGTPVTYRHAPPMLGEHTDSVMNDVLELSEDEIKALREGGVIA